VFFLLTPGERHRFRLTRFLNRRVSRSWAILGFANFHLSTVNFPIGLVPNGDQQHNPIDTLSTFARRSACRVRTEGLWYKWRPCRTIVSPPKTLKRILFVLVPQVPVLSTHDSKPALEYASLTRWTQHDAAIMTSPTAKFVPPDTKSKLG